MYRSISAYWTKVNGDIGQLVNRYIHLYNIKVNTSKINEDNAREKERDSKKQHGCAITQNKMVHSMLGYAEVYTDIKRIQVSTLPLKLRAGIDCYKINKFD